ncbi:hypothetical protein C7999DRAFT_36320 [Corynascus novoguineensis]|uniref:Uncharacterized protein n=1 Tax=Corynascus novoguineensis TaxID=1126955 RepID=A0AAN7CM80_9PEZI|nr:hypothetical protein C7999DRAFT_36320 [Corynascus novoguineensis]
MKFQIVPAFLVALLPLTALAAPAADKAAVGFVHQNEARGCGAGSLCVNGQCRCTVPCETGICSSYPCGTC